MRHIITYNEAAQGAYFRKVDKMDAKSRLKALGDDYFLRGEVKKMVRKAGEFGWHGELEEVLSIPGRGSTGFGYICEVLRSTELPSGKQSHYSSRPHPPRQANQVRLGVLPPEVPPYGFSLNILKSVDDYFFVELVEETDDYDGEVESHYVCDGIGGVIALMESIESKRA